LKNIGYQPINLKNAGYNILDLFYEANFSYNQLINVGFSNTDISFIQYDIRNINLISDKTILKTVGYTFDYLYNHNITLNQIKDVGYSASEIKSASIKNNITLRELKNAGFSVTQLKYRDFLNDMISDSNEILTFDSNNSILLCTDDDENEYLIDCSSGSFSYYDINTFSYKKYTQLVISTNGWLGFQENDIHISGDAIDSKFPINSIRFCCMDTIFTIKYKILNNMIKINLEGSIYDNLDYKINIIIHITNNGLFKIYYDTFQPPSFEKYNQDTRNFNTPIIGYVGNYPYLTIDDTYYKIGNKDFSNIEYSPFTELYQLEKKCIQLDLTNLNLSGYNASELYNVGFTIQELKNAGYGANELYNLNVTLTDLSNIGYKIEDLIYAGFSINELFNIDGTTEQLLFIKSYNYGLNELKALNVYTLQQFYDVGYDSYDLKNAGYDAYELKSFFSITELKYDAAFLIYDLSLNGYSINDYIDTGFSISDLKNIGYTINEIKDICGNYTVLNYVVNGYTLTDISNAYSNNLYSLFKDDSVDTLKNNGIFAYDFVEIGYDISSILQFNYNITDLKNAGFTINQLIDASLVFINNDESIISLKNSGYTFKNLLDAGFSENILLPYKFPIKQIKEYNYSLNTLLSYHYDLNELRYRKLTDILSIDENHVNYDLNNMTFIYQNKDLILEYITLNEPFYYYNYSTQTYTSYKYIYMTDDGFLFFSNSIIDPNSVKKEGIDSQIPTNTIRFLSRDNWSSASYKYINNDNIQIYYTGQIYFFNVDYRLLDFELILNINKYGLISCYYKYLSNNLIFRPIIGYVGNDQTLTNDDVYLKIIKNNNEIIFNVNNNNAEYNVKDLLEYKNVYFDLTNINETGFLLNDLSNSFTTRQLLDASFTISEFKNVGYDALQMKLNGVDLSNLVIGGYNTKELKDISYSAFDLKPFFTLQQLLNASYNANDLSNCNFVKNDYQNINYDVYDLINIGFKKSDYIGAGYSISDLSYSGFLKSDYINVDYNVLDLKNDGNFNKNDFINIEYNIFELKEGGFLFNDFIDTQYTLNDLKNSGFTIDDYKSIGCSIYDLLIAFEI
jgi:hypothetical protein